MVSESGTRIALRKRGLAFGFMLHYSVVGSLAELRSRFDVVQDTQRNEQCPTRPK